MTKAVLICGIIIYLFLSSLLISVTYVEVDEYWQPTFTTEIPKYNINFTATSNISHYGIEVTRGAWVIENNQLASRSLIDNEFVIITDELEKPLIIYNVSNLEEKTRFYIYARHFVLEKQIYDSSYFEFDVENNIINSVSYSGFYNEYYVLETKPYSFTKEDYIVKTDCTVEDKWWAIITEDVVCSLTIDDVKFTEVLFEDLSTRGLVYYAGVYTEQWDFRINFINALETYKETDVDSILNYLDVIAKIIFFIPPDIIMPFWMNFIFFKIPLIAIVWIGIETFRGID